MLDQVRTPNWAFKGRSPSSSPGEDRVFSYFNETLPPV